ncbi:MobV family relaxase [Hallella bergensis]|uniref:MobV family relaxase n=1 Tax=Hallella bergensis TaxID=242750 RepID=UPI0023F3EBBF|nr:MobV family relaxase [Hallella bergensis]
MNTQYAVCHLQRGSGNDSGMSCHIERKDAKGNTYVPENADASRTHLNRELITFPDGVRNRTGAIQYRIENAGLHRKVGKNQCKAIRIILTGTHEQIMKLYEEGKLGKWIEANRRRLYDTFGKDNVVSMVLHMDENTPHLHATIIPIVASERKRREREGEKKYQNKSGSRLSADDVMKRDMLRHYQDTYAAAMKPFGLERGVVGSTLKHRVNTDYYKQLMQQCEDDITKLQEELERAKEGKSTLLAIFGRGDLAKAKKELAAKDAELAKLKEKIAKCETEKVALIEKHAKEMASQKNGYQKEIAAAIKRAETAERASADKDNTIEQQKLGIRELDRKANPQRYRLSSGAKLVGYKFMGNNPYTHTVKIWTKVNDIEYSPVAYISCTDNRLKAFGADELTDHEFINALFSAAEQVNAEQKALLQTIAEMTMGGPAQPHVGTGGGGSTSTIPWNDKDKDLKNNVYGRKRK